MHLGNIANAVLQRGPGNTLIVTAKNDFYLRAKLKPTADGVGLVDLGKPCKRLRDREYIHKGPCYGHGRPTT